MKKLNIVTAIGVLGLVIVACMGVTSAAVIQVPTPPNNAEVIKQNADTQTKVIVSCPHTIQVGPVYVPAGWQSLGSLARQRVAIAIDKKQRLVVCWYGIPGGDQNLFTANLISQPLPAGYDCTIPYPNDYAAVCTKGIHIPK